MNRISQTRGTITTTKKSKINVIRDSMGKESVVPKIFEEKMIENFPNWAKDIS